MGVKASFVQTEGRALARQRVLPETTCFDQAAPAMYRATRPQEAHLSVTCERGAGGMSSGDRSMLPEHDGQLSGDPVRSLAMRFSACAGLYVAGRGLRMGSS